MSDDPRLIREEVERLSDRLRLLSEEFQNFAYVVSHDLKEPLRSLNNSVQLLERLCGDGLEPKARQCIRFATEATTRLYRLLDGLVAYSSAARGAEVREDVSFEALLRDVLSASRLAISESGAVVTQGKLPQAHGVRAQLFQVLYHLLNNAIRYRSERPLVIYVEGKKAGSEIRFSVADNGQGIDPKQFDRIFGIFQRAAPPSEDASGIGLAICRTVIQQHGGRIWVESEPSQGATFFFTLPAMEGET